MHLHCELLLFTYYFHTPYTVCTCACVHRNSHLCDAKILITRIDAHWLHVSYIWGLSRGQAVDTSPHWTIVILSPTMVNQGPPLSTALNSGLLPCTHTRTHTHRAHKRLYPCCWSVVMSHSTSFLSRPLLLSNWSSSEYNYAENHPGLMWGWINGIKKIICWPSGPATVWGWEGNLKQREEERGGL